AKRCASTPHSRYLARVPLYVPGQAASHLACWMLMGRSTKRWTRRSGRLATHELMTTPAK
ncbi:hypothetical protein, partial [Archangium sp.]|uniref:hypothetical protein n=1 Tax=Archangium sp. TaxID=1872627 RepID=UPI002D6DC3FE